MFLSCTSSKTWTSAIPGVMFQVKKYAHLQYKTTENLTYLACVVSQGASFENYIPRPNASQRWDEGCPISKASSFPRAINNKTSGSFTAYPIPRNWKTKTESLVRFKYVTLDHVLSNTRTFWVIAKNKNHVKIIRRSWSMKMSPQR